MHLREPFVSGAPCTPVEERCVRIHQFAKVDVFILSSTCNSSCSLMLFFFLLLNVLFC